MMSGGHFDYNQYRINDIAEEMEILIRNNTKLDDWGCARNYSQETIARFKEAKAVLERAAVYAQRIDWLVSGDDGEQEFHRCLTEELSKLESQSDDTRA